MRMILLLISLLLILIVMFRYSLHPTEPQLMVNPQQIEQKVQTQLQDLLQKPRDAPDDAK